MFKPTKNKLSVFFLVLTFLPLLVMRLVVYPITFKTIKDEIVKNLDIAANKQVDLLSKWMEDCIAGAQHIAENPFLVQSLKASAGKNKYTEFFQYMDEINYFDFLWKTCGHRDILITDDKGIVKNSSNKDLVGTDISAKDYYKSAKNGLFFSSNIRPSDILIENAEGVYEAGAPTMFVSVPIKDQKNTIVGVVAIRIDVSKIDTMMRNIHLGETGETYLIDSNGYMLTSSRFTKDLKDQGLIKNRSALELKVINPVTGTLTDGVRECLSGTEGYNADGYLDYRGVNVLGFWHWMPDYHWGIIAEIDASEGYGSLYKLRDSIMFVFAALALGVIFVAFFLGKKMSAPLRHIADLASNIANGSYKTRVDYHSDDELGKLANAINIMAEKLDTNSRTDGPDNVADESQLRKHEDGLV